jgi:prepilin-type N-terminal cleavage/methylation domain-containing protein
MRYAGPAGCRAFTLVEVLATLTIASLLVVCMVSSTRGLTTAREKVECRVERSINARQALETIVGVLRNVRNDPRQRYPVVVGTSGGSGSGNDRIDLLVMSDTPARPDGAESDQYEASFYLMRRQGKPFPSLMFRKDHALDEYPEEGGIATVVADGITALSFEYFAEGEWMTEWPRERTITPKAVRVTLQAASAPLRGREGRPETSALSTVVPLRAGKAGTVIRPEPQPGAPSPDQPTPSPERKR